MGHHEVNHSVNVICNLGKENRKKSTLSDTVPYSNRITTGKIDTVFTVFRLLTDFFCLYTYEL